MRGHWSSTLNGVLRLMNPKAGGGAAAAAAASGRADLLPPISGVVVLAEAAHKEYNHANYVVVRAVC